MRFDLLAGQNRGLLLGSAALLTFFVLGVWWLLQPSYAVLLKDASEAGRAEVTALLTQQHIAYRLAKDGAVEVVEDQRDMARSKLAEAGLPAKPSTGYELFDNADYGMSEFAQKINYQRALEGELARSIMRLAEIKAARVHLLLRKSSLYASQQEPAKASVVLELRPGLQLDRRQISGIQQLVASAVEGLTPETVVVIDETGQPLSGYQALSAFDDRWQVTSRVEAELQAKAQQVLDNIYGNNGARASVRVQMNFDRVRSIKELPIATDASGNSVVTRERQQNSTDRKKGGSDGVNDGKEQHSEEVEYAVGKDHSEVEYSPGRIERMTVGVVLSNRLANVDTAALSDLMSAALGMNEARGDRLSIAHMPLAASAPSGTAPAVKTAAFVETPQVKRSLAWAEPAMWLLMAAVLAIALLVIAVSLRQRRAGPPPISAAEREKLLQDIRAWLAKDAQEEVL